MIGKVENSCAGCGTLIPPSKGGPPRKWCSDRCRKTLYAKTCIDCGGPTNGSNGANSAERCGPCQHAKQHDDAFWTREQIIADAYRWRELTGRWPVTGDWNRAQNRGRRRELIDELHELSGPWPHIYTVQCIFGSWREFVSVLGGEAMPVHSGGRGRSKAARTDELAALVEGLKTHA